MQTESSAGKNNINLGKLPHKEYKKIVARTRDYWLLYKNPFKENSYDLQDLIQESLLKAYETIEKFPELEGVHLNKTIQQAVTWHMNNLLRESIQKTNTFITLEDDMLKDLEQPMKDLDFMDYMHKIKDEKSLKVVYKRVEEEKSFEQISKEMGLSVTWVYGIYKRAIRKLRPTLGK